VYAFIKTVQCGVFHQAQLLIHDGIPITCNPCDFLSKTTQIAPQLPLCLSQSLIDVLLHSPTAEEGELCFPRCWMSSVVWVGQGELANHAINKKRRKKKQKGKEKERIKNGRKMKVLGPKQKSRLRRWRSLPLFLTKILTAKSLINHYPTLSCSSKARTQTPTPKNSNFAFPIHRPPSAKPRSLNHKLSPR